MTVNDPDVIAGLRDWYLQYERAVVTHDVENPVEIFLGRCPRHALHATENLYGHKEIGEFREARPSANPARTVTRLDVAAFGKDFERITLAFGRGSQREPQSKTWVRFHEAWRMVAGHVFLIPSL